MCGVAGLYLTNNEFPKATKERIFSNKNLETCIQNLNHRGPDDSGTFVDQMNDVALLHTRLSILDTSLSAHQPMGCRNNNVIIVFNGEIYNFKEIKKELDENYKIKWNSTSDTEVILQYYINCRARGYDINFFLRKLKGIFSLAIWDKCNQKLIIARDALGVKPLYYFSSKHGLAFASEIKALIPLLPELHFDDLGDLMDINQVAIDRYLTYLWCPGESTPFKEIKKLGSGEVLIIKNGLISEHFPWYELPGRKGCINSQKKSEIIKNVQYHLRKSVHRQMLSDVPLGAFLSGGLDSSSIVAFAKEIDPNIQCFTISISGLKEDFIDDLPYAKEVANYLKVPLEIINVEPDKILTNIEQMVWQLDEPLADLAPLNLYYMTQLARSKGIKVLLSGAGGDDIFTGYRRHYALRKEKLWNWLPYNIRDSLKSYSGKLNVDKPFLRRVRKVFSAADLSSNERIVNYFRWMDRKDLESLYSNDFRNSIKDAECKDEMLDYLYGLSPNISIMDKMLLLEQKFFLVDHNLNYTDKMSMASGVEVRVPFLDLDLIEYVSTIPSELKQNGRQSKWILKKSMEGMLPKNIIYRSKTSFGVPLRHWLKFYLKEWLDDLLSKDNIVKRGLFDPVAVNKLITDNSNGKIDASYTLFSMAVIEIWFRHFIDNKAIYNKPIYKNYL
tara:strand:- start:661 stop:2673 length:2013 start_codon:yes stop_codon:yes gene_type:complete